MTPLPQISLTRPVNEAIEHVKRVLFRPFDLGKWFTIGFCAWLAELGQPGGMNYGNSSATHNTHDVHQMINQAKAWFILNSGWFVPLAVVVLIFSLALVVTFLWLSSRGKFMFLHCVALDKAEVVVPWHQYSREGNSLFLFRIVLWICSMAAMLPFVAGMIYVGFGAITRNDINLPDVIVLIGLGLGLMTALIVLVLIAILNFDFVVPIQYLRRCSCMEAWGQFLGLLKAQTGEFILYLLFRIVLHIAMVAITIAAIIATCCLAGCLLVIPYIGTVAALPLLVFKRTYSVSYLAQYGPEWDILKRPLP